MFFEAVYLEAFSVFERVVVVAAVLHSFIVFSAFSEIVDVDQLSSGSLSQAYFMGAWSGVAWNLLVISGGLGAGAFSYSVSS